MAKYDSLRLKEKKNNKIATIKIMVCGIAIAFTEEVCGKFQRNPQFFINQRLLLVDALGPGVALGVRWGTRDVAAVCGVQDFLAVTCSESSERHWKGLGYAPPPPACCGRSMLPPRRLCKAGMWLFPPGLRGDTVPSSGSQDRKEHKLLNSYHPLCAVLGSSYTSNHSLPAL